MTKILVDRSVLEQALEALVARGKRGDSAPEEVATLRCALAQQAEPVAWEHIGMPGSSLSPSYTSSPAAQQAEPVAELRRLHDENQMLESAYQSACNIIQDQDAKLVELEGQQDALLEALKLALASHGVILTSDPPQDAWKARRVAEIARAAIKAAEENT